jgi:glycosyltransferase involved in cell wall biosynthesis
MKKTSKNIGILTFPISEAGNIPLSNLVDILQPLSNNLYLITGNDGYRFFEDYEGVHTYGIEHESGKNVITRVTKYIYTQLKISYTLFKLREEVDFYIFFIGGEGLILPMLTVKLLNKKVISAPADYTLAVRKDIPSQVLKSLLKVNRSLSDCIILHSPDLIEEWNLEKYRNKISIAHEYFLDFNKFKIITKFNGRANVVGYIGRLSEEKGVLNFVQAIPELLKEFDTVEFLIGGDGHLKDKIEAYLDENDLNVKVKLAGWIPHDKLPDCLNELKLLVIPSYTESGPIIALEAMACGTPILATRVGHILNMIKDGETGFIMENNSPECIAENMMRALEHPNLEGIVKSARQLVEKEFTYEAAVEKYRKILENI